MECTYKISVELGGIKPGKPLYQCQVLVALDVPRRDGMGSAAAASCAGVQAGQKVVIHGCSVVAKVGSWSSGMFLASTLGPARIAFQKVSRGEELTFRHIPKYCKTSV